MLFNVNVEVETELGHLFSSSSSLSSISRKLSISSLISCLFILVSSSSPSRCDIRSPTCFCSYKIYFETQNGYKINNWEKICYSTFLNLANINNYNMVSKLSEQKAFPHLVAIILGTKYGKIKILENAPTFSSTLLGRNIKIIKHLYRINIQGFSRKYQAIYY